MGFIRERLFPNAIPDFQGVGKILQKNVKNDIHTIQITLQLIQDGTDQNLNNILHKFFDQNKYKFNNNYQKFIDFIIVKINEFINFINDNETSSLSAQETEKSTIIALNFEKDYGEILFYQRRLDNNKIRNIIKRRLRNLFNKIY